MGPSWGQVGHNLATLWTCALILESKCSQGPRGTASEAHLTKKSSKNSANLRCPRATIYWPCQYETHFFGFDVEVHLRPHLYPSWAPFWCQVGPKLDSKRSNLDPSWSQVGPKSAPKSTKSRSQNNTQKTQPKKVVKIHGSRKERNK